MNIDWSDFSNNEREILRFLHEDATFDVRLIVDDLDDAQLSAAYRLIDLDLVKMSGGSLHLTAKGISYMVDSENEH